MIWTLANNKITKAYTQQRYFSINDDINLQNVDILETRACIKKTSKGVIIFQYQISTYYSFLYLPLECQ